MDQPPELTDAPAQPREPPEVRPATRHEPVFSGRAGEYFGIWIVNVLLSILTLGIYSAWAKVRTERYFYGNTRIAGSPFEYLADPVRILVGRLIAYAVVAVLVLTSHFMPLLYFVVLLAIFALMPVIVFLALRFRARYSAWRGLRFAFTGTAGQAYGPFMGWTILSWITLTLLYPIMRQRRHAYIVDGHRFGGRRFSFHGGIEAYYPPYLIVLASGIGAFVVLVVAMVASMALLAQGSGKVMDQVGPFIVVALLIPFYALMFVFAVFLHVRYTNLMWNNTRLQGQRFESTLRFRDVLWLYFSNLVAVLFTLGLATPWAMIRLARYRASRFAVLADDDLDAFVAEIETNRSAAGAELVDALDIGVDLGL